MPLKALFAAVTVTAVIAQLLLRRASHALPSPSGLASLPRFLGSAVTSPWIYASASVQILGYVLWLLLIGREKLGIATAGVGAGYYILIACSAWLFYGETLSPAQWLGMFLITLGVVCVGTGS